MNKPPNNKGLERAMNTPFLWTPRQVKNLREDLHMTQQDFGIKLGRSRAWIQQLEKNGVIKDDLFTHYALTGFQASHEN